MTTWKLAWTHLTRKKTSTFIAILGVAISVMASGLLLRTYLLSKARFNSIANTSDAIVGAKSGSIQLLLGALNLEGEYPDFIPLNLYNSLSQGQNIQFEDGATSTSKNIVEMTLPFLVFAKFENYRVIATNELFIQSDFSNLPKLAVGSWPQNQNEVVIGDSVAKNKSLTLEQTIKADVWLDKSQKIQDQINLKIVGILKPTQKSWDNGIYTNFATSDLVLTKFETQIKSIWKTKLLSYFLVYLRPDNSFKSMQWLQSLINQRTVAQTVATDTAIKELEDLTSSQQNLGLLISCIIIFLGALTATMMMLTRFEGMSQQLAVLRALGYKRSQLVEILFYEASILATTSIVIGASFDAIIFPIVQTTFFNSGEFYNITIANSYPVWLTAILGCWLSVIIPLIKLYKQNIHTSLRNST